MYAKPVDMATMNKTMRKCKDISAALGQHHSFQTIDQQLYAFAQQLKWAFPDEDIWSRYVQSQTFLFLDNLLQTLQILLLNVWKERESDRALHPQRYKSWFHISLLLTDKRVPDGFDSTLLTC